jgi:uncharacterized protein YcbK (DUF882 family)
MYKCKYFKIQELVSKKIYQELGEKAWILFDERLLKTADKLREKFGITFVNDWHRNGKFSNRGFRSKNCKIGSKYSQHKFGRAIDCHFRKISTRKARKYILKNQNKFSEIKGIEMKTNWLHFDVGNRGEKIVKFYVK